VSTKDQKPFITDLKSIYKAATKDMAEQSLTQLEVQWGKKYPMVVRSWQSKWEELSTYFKYSEEVRRFIYTINPIEGFHRQVGRYTKLKGAFTSETALSKLLYCPNELQSIKDGSALVKLGFS
jgi:putative transposase